MAQGAPFPVSDHCDGRRFFNPLGRPQARSFSDLPRWWWQQIVHQQGTRWPKTLPVTQVSWIPVAETIPDDKVAVTFVGHSTFLVQFAGLNILTDPIFSDRAGPFGLFGPKRVREPAIAPWQLPPIDVILLSHNHYDHLDLGFLQYYLRNPELPKRPTIITTLGNVDWLWDRGVKNAVELDWWQSHRIGSMLEVVCTPAQHFAARTPWDRCKTLWGGFALRTPHGSVYFCGDSGWGPHFAEIGEKLGGFDLALMPIGAYEPRWFMIPVHVNPDEAVRAHLAVKARRSIGMHFGTFQLTDEAIDAPLHALAEARTIHGVAPANFDTLDFGETRVVPLCQR